jgi:hypothetical protein
MDAAVDLHHAPDGRPVGVALVVGPGQIPAGEERFALWWMDKSHRVARALRAIKTPLTILLAAAIYGFSGGSSDGMRGAVRGLIKFPLLIFLTSSLCSLAWWVTARFLHCKLSFGATVMSALKAFADASFLLAALAPVNLFLGQTMILPTRTALNEYPLFLGLNVAFIAVCGTAAVIRQVSLMRKAMNVSLRQASNVAAAWLAIGLFVGGQCSWYLRPFYGIRAVENERFIVGTLPDSFGATSFYEAVYHIFRPPPLPEDYWQRGGTNR